MTSPVAAANKMCLVKEAETVWVYQQTVVAWNGKEKWKHLKPGLLDISDPVITAENI